MPSIEEQAQAIIDQRNTDRFNEARREARRRDQNGEIDPYRRTNTVSSSPEY